MNANTIVLALSPSLMSNLTILNEHGTLWAITGRIPGRDDDHTHFILCSTEEEAIEAFTTAAYEDRGMDVPQPGDDNYIEGEVIYITDQDEVGTRVTLPLAPATSEQDSEFIAEPGSEPQTPESDYEVHDADNYTPGLPDKTVDVTAVDGSSVQWLISPNLTDRWGEINEFDSQCKPLYELISEPGLLDALRTQMIDETTFVARKDGVFGLLYEVEYVSIESDGHEQEETCKALKPHSQVVASLIAGLQKNSGRLPGVQMCVPCVEEIANDRPAVWAFVPNGLLAEDARSELSAILMSL